MGDLMARQAYTVNMKTKDFVAKQKELPVPTDATFLVPVRRDGGVLIVGGLSITHFDSRDGRSICQAMAAKTMMARSQHLHQLLFTGEHPHQLLPGGGRDASRSVLRAGGAGEAGGARRADRWVGLARQRCDLFGFCHR